MEIKQISQLIEKLNNKWSTYLGCSVAQLTDNKRHVVLAKEFAGSERPPWPALLRPIRLFTVSEGWILSVPPEMVEIAEASCLDLSYDDFTAEGDRILQEWFDSRNAHKQSPRPNGEVYLNLQRLMGNRQCRGWSHYVFSYCNIDEWTDSDDPHIVNLQNSSPNIKNQWDNWPGPMCSKGHQTHFEVADALGYALDGKLVAVGQIEAYHSEYFWEYGIDTLVEYRGHGYATAVCRALTSFIIQQGHMPYHYTDIYNRPSRRLPEKLGYFEHGRGVFCHLR